jgi:hypothetical protein
MPPAPWPVHRGRSAKRRAAVLKFLRSLTVAAKGFWYEYASRMTPFFEDWKRFCLVLREIAIGAHGQPLSGIDAQKRAQDVLAQAGYRWSGLGSEETQISSARGSNHPDLYRQTIQDTFAKLYGVPTAAVDVAWTSEAITVYCAGTIFTRRTDSNDEFVSANEDPVTITLTDDERDPLEHRN